jgi:dihydroorotase
MSVRPAVIGRLSGIAAGKQDIRHGCSIEPGSPANLVLYDTEPIRPVETAAHASRSHNSPFAGMKLPGQVIATFLRGTPTVLDGRLAS